MRKLLAIALLSFVALANAEPLTVGAVVYTDRDFTFTDVGPYVGYQYFQVANNGKSEPLTVDHTGPLYLAVDDRITAPDGFADTGNAIVTTDASFSVYLDEDYNGAAIRAACSYGGCSQYIPFVNPIDPDDIWHGSLTAQWQHDYKNLDGEDTDVLDYSLAWAKATGDYRLLATVADDDSGAISHQFDLPATSITPLKGEEFCVAVNARNEIGSSDYTDPACVTLTEQTEPPALVTVPDVVGMSLVDATSAIVGAGLVVGDVSYIEGQPVDVVASQTPQGATEVEEGSAIDLVINQAGQVEQVIPVPPGGLILKLIPVQQQ